MQGILALLNHTSDQKHEDEAENIRDEFDRVGASRVLGDTIISVVWLASRAVERDVL